jgi:GMP synthase (glutamine-hydrolysing)
VSSSTNKLETIIVLDYGSQYNQLIARRIRELGVFSELKSHKITAAQIREIATVGIILSGGPNSVYDEASFDIDTEIFELGLPILGICYGMQLMSYKLGGNVEAAGEREYGVAPLSLQSDSALFTDTPGTQNVLMSHGDRVTAIPEGFQVVATSPNSPYAAVEDKTRNFFGIQFHPEVRHSVYGNAILKNFAFNICRAKGDWSMENFIERQIQQIRAKVGERKVLLGLSGGVDSSVVGVLL